MTANLIYAREQARALAFDCGYTYKTGGRPELDEAQQREVAEGLARTCCGSRETREEFVEQFLIGYAERKTTPIPLVERRGMYEVTIYSTHEDWIFIYRDGTRGQTKHRIENDNPVDFPVCCVCGRKWARQEPVLYYEEGNYFSTDRKMTCPICYQKQGGKQCL